MQQRTIGRYQVLNEIAAGGQGIVYRARDTSLGRIVALKVLHPLMSRDAVVLQRFQREARLAASVSHPNVTVIYEVGNDGDQHFIAMEYLPSNVHDLIQSRGRVPVARAVEICLQAEAALGAAAEQGIIHRDIKPQNLLLTADGTVKVTDFGIARASELSTITRTGALMGTPLYMSPEQAQGSRVDPRSDIYSLGIVLYELLTGKVPFDATTPFEMMRQHIETPPQPVRQSRPEVTEELERMIDRCLEKDPTRRYQSHADLAQALTSTLPSATQQERQTRQRTAQPPSEDRPTSTPRQTRPAAGTPSQRAHRRASSSRAPAGLRKGSIWPRWGWAALLVSVVSVFAIVAASQGWFSGNRAATGPSGPDHPSTPLPAVAGELAWRYETDGVVGSSPAVSDGVVYVGSSDNHVYALDAMDGSLIWRFETGKPVGSLPTVSDGVVYVGSGDYHVYAMDALDGTPLWRYETGGDVFSSPTVWNGVVYVGSWDNHVYALDAADGTLIWRYETDRVVWSSPAVWDGVVYVGSFDNHVYALDAVGGRLLWRYETGDSVLSSPMVWDGVVYVGSLDNHVYALDAVGGRLLWRYETGDSGWSSPMVWDGVVYVGSSDNHVYALDAMDGSLIWRFETGKPVGSLPTLWNGVVYVGSHDHYVYALDAADGSLIWRYETGGEVFSSPTVWNGVVYVGSLDNHLYAIGAATGEPR